LCPKFAPTFPKFAPTFPKFTPTFPKFTPTFPEFSPTFRKFAPTAGGLAPTAEDFAPTAGSLAPTAGDFAPTAGGFAPGCKSICTKMIYRRPALVSRRQLISGEIPSDLPHHYPDITSDFCFYIILSPGLAHMKLTFICELLIYMISIFIKTLTVFLYIADLV
jgi:hypothetical protein